MMRTSTLKTLVAVVAALVAFAASGAAQEPGAPAKPATAPSAGHYIEFRAASIGTYGHSYVVYGRLNARGEPADTHYTDRHPVGNYGLMAIGHVLPVPANTRWNPEVLKLPISSSYRHKLTAAQYQNLLREIRVAQAEKSPTWQAIANNCNHYAARLARAAGLKAPDDLQLSYGFVPSLRALNARSASPKPAASSPSIPRT
jgi:hypothetical protein